MRISTKQQLEKELITLHNHLDNIINHCKEIQSAFSGELGTVILPYHFIDNGPVIDSIQIIEQLQKEYNAEQ